MKRRPRIQNRISFENFVNLVILILIFYFLLSHLNPALLLSPTTTSGGDMGSDNYLAKYMKDYLLPHGKIVGWCQGRWGGYPIFQFIFPLPYVFIAVLGYIIPLEISFKLITVLGIFLLPLTTFLAMRAMKFKFPIPVFASIFTLFFLFQEKNTTFGGNVASVLAGEFSYSISFSLMVLFIGYFYRSVIFKKKVSIFNSVLFGAVFLTHSITAIFTVLSSLFFLLEKKRFWTNFKILFFTFLFSLLLISFWLIPLMVKLEYTTNYGRDWPFMITEWYPKESIVFFVLSIFGVLYAYKNRDRRIGYFLFMILVSFLGFMIAEEVKTANIRFWPFQYFSLLLIASYGLGEIVRTTKHYQVAPIILVILTIVYLNHSISFTDAWIKWNYEGFEAKPTWPIYKGINELLVNTTGRIYNDLSDENDRLGTPRAFESLPYFSGRPTLEGVYAQSTITSPFISYTQCEISHHCAGIPTVAGKERTTSYNLTAGTEHLKVLNVKYLIAVYDRLKQDLAKNSEWKFIKRFDDWEIYELLTNDGKYVTVPKFEPNAMIVKGDEWKKISLDWWTNLSDVNTPLVFVRNKEDLDKFQVQISDLSQLRQIPINNSCNINEIISNEEIKFTTDCVGKPHIVKISYFPNWDVEGADKVYLVSPSFMLVFPKSSEVRIFYTQRVEDNTGNLLSLIGLTILILHKKFFVFVNRFFNSKIF